jgi:hypothetical protein
MVDEGIPLPHGDESIQGAVRRSRDENLLATGIALEIAPGALLRRQPFGEAPATLVERI